MPRLLPRNPPLRAPTPGDRQSAPADHPLDRACPACRSPLRDGDCRGCGRAFPIVAGLPDFRLQSDRYLELGAERAKAERLAALAATTDVHGLARHYYDMTRDVGPERRSRYLAHIHHAERRGAALAARLPLQGRVLEVGCGTGGLLVAAARRGIAIEGADIAARWLVLARRRLDDQGIAVPLVAAGADRLPWRDQCFDAVVADSVLEHLDDPAAALREWARVVRPGGRLLIWSPNRFTLTSDPHTGLWGVGWLPWRLADGYVRWRGRGAWTVRPCSADGARRLAASSGWRSIRVGSVAVPEDWARTGRERSLIRLSSTIGEWPPGRIILRWFGPLWQLEAIAPGSER